MNQPSVLSFAFGRWALLGATLLNLCLLPALAGASQSSTNQAKAPPTRQLWRGVHLMAPEASQLPLVKRAIAEVLVPMGVNVIVLEVDYKFAWESHPELRTGEAITKDQAGELAALCRQHSIRLIPLFNCLGHQSWAKHTLPLLAKHPELDETPQIPPDNPGIYCRSWCPQHPQVNAIVLALMDELLAAFAADALHVGMDEVFLIASDQCPRCRGQEPAKLFAKAVNDYHRHLVGEKKVTMLMWGDRLLEDKEMKYGQWESSRNGTAAAIDLIPKDIVICDWHYELREAYPSVPFFQTKGFWVWPSSWRNHPAALALLEYARQNAGEKLLGHLCTTWTSSAQVARVLLGEADTALQQPREIVETMRACLGKMAEGKP
jgi:hypothetical protein